MTNGEYFVLYGSPTATSTPPHGGACDYCNETKPEVYEDGNGKNTCADCDRYDDKRRDEYRQEKLHFWQQRKQGGNR